MNETQRQLLADELDELGRTIERYDKAIQKLESQLITKRTNRDILIKRKAQLEEGIDW